jgi:hypothetical protein
VIKKALWIRIGIRSAASWTPRVRFKKRDQEDRAQLQKTVRVVLWAAPLIQRTRSGEALD